LCIFAPVNSYAVISKVGFFSGTQTTAPATPNNLNQATPYAMKWASSKFDSNYFNHSTSSFSHQVTVLQAGDYKLTLAVPLYLTTTTGSRRSVRAEVYVNGTVIPHAIAESSYVRNANDHQESSLHLGILLKSLSANDKIEVKFNQATATGDLDTSGAKLFVEFVDLAKDIFYATGTRTTNSTNLNQATAFEMEWSNVDVKDSIYTHNIGSTPEDITVSSTDAYFVFVNIPLDHSVACTNQRVNIIGELLINGSPISGGSFSQGYIRCTQGHTRSSIHWFGVIDLSNTDTLSVSVQAETTILNTITVPGSREASLYMERIDSTSESISLTSSSLTSGTNWNTATAGVALQWNTQRFKDATTYSHNTATNSEEITFNESGDYLLYYTDELTTTSARINPNINFKLNGVTLDGGECATHYMRNGNGHNNSSCTTILPLTNISSGDILRIETALEAQTGTATSTGVANLTIQKKTNEIPTFDIDDIPNKVLHLDGSDFTSVLDGSSRNANDTSFASTDVEDWNDVSGSTNIHNATQATAASRPDFDTTNKMMQFDGTDDHFDFTNHTDLNLGTLDERTFAIAFKTNADVTSRQVIYEEGGTVRGLNVYIRAGNLYIGVWNNTNDGDGVQAFTSSSTAVAANTHYYVSLVFDYSNYSGPTGPDGELRGHINGVKFSALGTTTSRLYAHAGLIALGAMENDSYFDDGTLSGNGAYFNGSIFEFIMWNSAIDDGTAVNIYDYLVNKWPDPQPVTNLALSSQYTSVSGSSPLLSWTASISPDVDHYEVAVGTSQGATDTHAYSDEGNVTSTTITGMSLTECTNYFASVKAVDTEPKESTVVSSDFFKFDATAPTSASNTNVLGSASTTVSKQFTWYPATDSCSFSHYELAIGTTPGASDTVSFTDIGNVTSYQFTGITLATATNYYFSLRAVDSAGNRGTAINSSAWQVDTCVATDVTNPTDPSALNLSGAAGPTTSENLAWTASTDACGLSHYEVAIGLSSGASDVVAFTNVGDVTSYKFFSLSPSLSTNTNYYLSVRAVDLAGNPSGVASAGPWTLPSPGGVDPTGLEIWYDADDIGTLYQNAACTTPVTADGQNVLCWQDKSASANNATIATNNPTYQTNEFNGMPVIRFDGTNDTLDFGTGLSNIRTVFVVNKSDSNNHQLLLGDTTTQHWYTNNGTLLANGTASSNLISGTWKVNRSSESDPSNYNQSGQYSLYSVVTAGNVDADHLSSDRKVGGRFFQGDIVEVIIYSRALSSTEVEDVENYLYNKWFDAAPDAPTDITYSNTYTSVSNSTPLISWTHSTAPDLNNYEMAIGTSPSANDLYGWTDIGLTNNKTVTGISTSECTPYYVSLKAFDTDTFVSPISEGTAFFYDGTAPTTPATGTLTGTANTTTSEIFTWSSASESCSFSHYEVAIGTTSGGDEAVSWTNVGNTNSHTFTGISPALTTATNYYTSVRGVDSAGNKSGVKTSSAWQVATCVATDTTDPTDPTSLSLTGLPGLTKTKTLSWNASTDSCGFSHYEVALGTTSGGTEVSGFSNIGTSTTYQYTGLSPYLNYTDTYYITVKAVDLAGNSSSEISSTGFTLTSPGGISATGLNLWIDLEDDEQLFTDSSCTSIASANDSRIKCLKDKSGSDNHAINANTTNAPKFKTSGFNGLQSAYFDGSQNEFLDFGSMTDIRTVFWVIQEDTSNLGDTAFLLGDPSGATQHFSRASTGGNIFGGSASANVTGGTLKHDQVTITGTTTTMPSSPAVLSLVTTGNTTASSFSRDRISCCGGRTWGGHLAELIIFNRALTAGEVTDVENYLMVKWGISPTSTEWLGSTDTNWFTPANWSNGVPTKDLDCIIDDKANDPVISSGTAICKDVQIGSGVVTMTNATSAVLEVHGDFTNTGTFTHNDGILRFTDDGVIASDQNIITANNLGNVEISKSAGGNLSNSSNDFAMESLTFTGTNTSTFKVEGSSTLTLNGGATINKGTFLIDNQGTVEVGNAQTITVSGGTFQTTGINDTYSTPSFQSETNKAKLTAVGGGSNDWSFVATSGQVSLSGFILDRIDVNGLQINGTSNLTTFQGGQFTNLKADYVTPVKALNLNTTTPISAAIAANIGFTWQDFNASAPGGPSGSDTYYLVYANDCGGNTIVFDGWFGDFYQQGVDPEAKIFDQDDTGPNCQVVMDIGASPVTLQDFMASGYDESILLTWNTIMETDHLGFNIYRSDSYDGNYVQINSSLLRNYLTSSSLRGYYRFEDLGLTNDKVYYYKIEDVAIDGSKKTHGPVSAKTDAANGSIPPAGAGENELPSPNPVIDLGAGVSILAQTNSSLRIKISPAALNTSVSSWDGNYKNVAINGYSKTIEADKPELLTRTVLIPVDVNFTSSTSNQVSINTSDKSGDLSGDDIAPAPSWVLNNSNVLEPIYSIDSNFYSNNQVLPSSFVTVSNTAKQIGNKYYLEVFITPLKYNPVANSLTKLDDIVLDVGLDGDAWDYSPPADTSIVEPSAWEGNLRIKYTAEGFYQISYDDLYNDYLEGPFHLENTSDLRLYYHGKELPIEIEDADGVFNSGDKISFYAPFEYSIEDNLDEVVLTLFDMDEENDSEYWDSPRRFDPVNNNNAIPDRDLDSVERTDLYEKNLTALFDVPIGGNIEHLYWKRLVTVKGSTPNTYSRLDVTADLNKLNQNIGSTVYIKVYFTGRMSFYSYESTKHHLGLKLNGSNLLDSVEFSTNMPTAHTFEIPSGQFVQGSNVIRLEAQGDKLELAGDYDMIYIDKVEITYNALNESDGTNLIIGNAEAHSQVYAGNFSSNQISIYDISNSNEGLKYQDQAINTNDGGSTYYTLFNTHPGEFGRSGKKLWIKDANSFNSVESLKLVDGYIYDLKDSSNGADLLIIGEQGLIDISQPLIDARESQGLEVMEVSYDQIYSQFSHGRVSIQAVKDFVQYTLDNYDVKPKYLLLLGDATYDSKADLAISAGIKKTPMPLVKGLHNDFGSDQWFGEDNITGLPRLSIGRIPTSDPIVLENYITKLLNYEAGDKAPLGDKLKTASYIVGTEDNEGFSSYVSNLSSISGQHFSSTDSDIVDRNQIGSDAATKTQINSLLNDSPLVVTYYGHGGEGEWGSYDGNTFYEVADAKALTNDKLPIIMAFNCLNGHFYDANGSNTSLAEEMVLNKDGGAVAFWGSTTLSSPVSQNNLATSFMNELVQESKTNFDKDTTIGDMFLASKLKQSSDAVTNDTVKSMVLIGDPSMRIPEAVFNSAPVTAAPAPASQASAAGGGCSAVADDGTGSNGPSWPFGLLEFLFYFLLLKGSMLLLGRIASKAN
tara:strand:- start:836 stop:10723 length:9888 start_codon:yes stop_codon:yes gene_type:complete